MEGSSRPGGPGLDLATQRASRGSAVRNHPYGMAPSASALWSLLDLTKAHLCAIIAAWR